MNVSPAYLEDFVNSKQQTNQVKWHSAVLAISVKRKQLLERQRMALELMQENLELAQLVITVLLELQTLSLAQLEDSHQLED